MDKVNSFLNAVEKVEKLLGSKNGDAKQSSSTEEDKKELLNLCLVELRRVYDGVLASMDSLRSKSLALLAAEIAIVAFLFAPREGEAFFTGDVPVYGIVLFGLGLALLGGAFILFLMSISKWTVKHPPEERDIVDIYSRFQSSPLLFLEYLKSEYMAALHHCIGVVAQRAKRFTWAVYALSIGLALVILVKYCSNLISIGGTT